MRRLVLILLLPIAACSSQPLVVESDCPVYDFDGRLSKGLVQPTTSQKSQFLEQLDEHHRDWEYCWYQTKEGEIEITVGDFGHFFVRDGETWKYDRDRTYIIISHEEP